MRKFTDLQTRKWLPSWQRKHKVKDRVDIGRELPWLGRAGLGGAQRPDVPWQLPPSHTTFSSSSSLPQVDNWQTQAAAQQEENSASCAAMGEQLRAAGAESQAAAPRSPRGHGRAVLDTLQRVARATCSRVAAAIRRRGRKPEPQREVEKGREAQQGREAAIAGTSTAAGPQSQDSALQSPCCPPSPFPSHLEALSGQWAGAAARAVVPVAESEDGACSEDESLWDISSLPEPSAEDENTEESWSSGEECSSVSLPCQARAHTPWDSRAGTASVSGPGVSSTSSDTRAKAPNPHGFPGRFALSPRPSDLEALSGQRAGTAAKAVLSVAPSQDATWSQELSDSCSLLELPQEEDSRDQSWGSGQKRFPLPVPREAWAEPRGLQAATARARAPVRRISSPYIRPKAPTPDARPPSPSPSQLEALSGPWTVLWTICGEWPGEENTEQPLSPEEDSNDSELSEKNGEGVQIYTIWVKPSLAPVLLQPLTACQEGPQCACLICAEAAEEAVGDLHSTPPAPAGGGHSQPTAAAPQRPRGCCAAVLDALQRVARATLRRIAAVIRRRGQQPGAERDLAGGMDAAMVATAPAAGAESQPAALHGPCGPPSPSPSQREALRGQWAGAAVQTVLPPPQSQEGAWSEDDSLWDVSSLLEGCQGQENTPQSCSTGAASSSGSLPCEPWPEPCDTSTSTDTSTD